jgi:2-iminobutanoate/2-iminopropanoate deaminase
MRIITSNNAPMAIGPYSQAVEKGGLLFLSGQLPINHLSGQIECSSIQEQTSQVLKNIEAILSDAGYSLKDVVKTTCYLKDMKNFSEMNEAYSWFFSTNAPARVTIEVSKLPKDALIEIDAIAIKE